MIDLKAYLTVMHESNSEVNDYSHKAASFGRDIVTIDLGTADYIFIGYRKPINAFYFNHNSIYANESIMKLEYFNGAAWINVDSLSDDTFGLKRSGYVRFERKQANQVSNTVNTYNRYWYRLSTLEERLDLSISGINLVFADDYELMLEQPYVTMPEFLDNLPSHILTHVACRNEILQSFRNKDYVKIDSNGIKQDVDQFDLLDIFEIKQAAVYLAMSKIYFNMSDSREDVWASKAHDYRSKYEKMLQIATLSLDLNDDGLASVDEVKTKNFISTYMSR